MPLILRVIMKTQTLLISWHRPFTVNVAFEPSQNHFNSEDNSIQCSDQRWLFLPFKAEAAFLSLINSRYLKGHCDTMTFEIVMSNPREQGVGEPLGETCVVWLDIYCCCRHHLSCFCCRHWNSWLHTGNALSHQWGWLTHISMIQTHTHAHRHRHTLMP